MRLLYLSNDSDLEACILKQGILDIILGVSDSLALFRFITKAIVDKLKQNNQNGLFSVEDGDFNAHVFMKDGGNVYVAVTDKKYPEKVAHRMLHKISTIDDLDQKDLESFLKVYQDPQVDSIYKVQQELIETTNILHQTMEKLFERGDSLADLIDKSAALSEQSKDFFKRAKRNNRWCPWVWFW